MAVFSKLRRRLSSKLTDKPQRSSGSEPEMVYLDESCAVRTRERETNHVDFHWEILHQYIKCLNAHNIDDFKALWSPSGVIKFPLGEMPAAIICEEMIKFIKSFPDATFCAAGIECIFSDKRKGIFRIKKFTLSGTHTGEAYGVGSYKPVKAAGVFVAPDPDFMILTVINGLVQEIQLTPHGPCSGLDGLYEQIGGRPLPPKKVYAIKKPSKYPTIKW